MDPQETTFTPGTPPAEGTETDNFIVPEEFKDKPYLKDVTSYNDVFKKLDGAESLIGQKMVFPDDNTSEEDYLKFNQAAGMPESPEGYTFEGEERDATQDDLVKAAYHGAGLSKKQAGIVQKNLEKLIIDNDAKFLEASTNAYNELSDKIFGDKADTIIASSMALAKANAPKEFGESLDDLPNDTKILLSGIVENIRKKYISSDGPTPPSDITVALSNEDLRKEAQKLRNDPIYKNPMHPEYNALKEKIDNIYKQLKT